MKRLPCTLAAAAVLLLAALPASAQLGGLPRPNLPSVPRDLTRLPGAAAAPMTEPATASLQALRRDTVRELLRNHADVLEPDAAGEPIRRRELLLLSPPRAALDAAIAQGFVLTSDQTLPDLGLTRVLLRAPPGVGTAEALAQLRAIDPALDSADFNHLYTRSGEAAATPLAVAPRSAATERRVGLIDSGIDRAHPALRHAGVLAWGCDGRVVPSPHGTAVASLLVGRDAAFTGAAPGALLYSADIYCEQPAAGAVDTLLQALAWMARERVAVINVSLVGPANRVLERAVAVLVDKGHLVVAAVGNDGPAAPALYPAAYAGVVGVTGVTTARRALPEAAQGAHVLLAAPGAELAVAQPGGGYGVARGTSFAAPLVAGLLAERVPLPDKAAAAAALARVIDGAQDLGVPGRDPVFGAGLVAERSRTSPESVQASLR